MKKTPKTQPRTIAANLAVTKAIIIKATQHDHNISGGINAK